MRVRWADGGPVGEPERFVELPSSTPAVHTSRTIGFGRRKAVRFDRLVVRRVRGGGRATDYHPGLQPRRLSAGPYAIGLRNAIGFDLDPATGRLWAGDNGQDNGGADFPPDEINLIEAGKHYGFPFFVGKNVPNKSPLGDAKPNVTAAAPCRRRSHCRRTWPPAICGSTQARSFPRPIGMRCSSLFMARPPFRKRSATRWSASYEDGRPAAFEDFVSGWVKAGVVSGRPAGLATGADGALYVSDDNKGFIFGYRFCLGVA